MFTPKKIELPKTSGLNEIVTEKGHAHVLWFNHEAGTWHPNISCQHHKLGQGNKVTLPGHENAQIITACFA